MKNPLPGFDWNTLYDRYDSLCRQSYDCTAPSLYSFAIPPPTDRDLYYALVERVREENNNLSGISAGTYEAIIYWKLYSSNPLLCKRLNRKDPTYKSHIQKTLGALRNRLSASSITRDINTIKCLYRVLNEYTDHLYGMISSCAFPVRSTLLHFIYPEIISIFDRKVLMSVGLSKEDAKAAIHKEAYLWQYTQHAWGLVTDKSVPPEDGRRETRLRLLDMALWAAAPRS
jgi:hypothetical protein